MRSSLPSAPSDRLRWVVADAEHRIATRRNLVLAAWMNAPTVERLDALRRVIGDLGRARANDFAVWNVVLSGVPKFGDAERAALVELVGDTAMQGRGVAHVFLLEGLAGVAARAFVGTALLVGRARSHRAFSDERAAAAWLAPSLSEGRERWSVDDLLAASDALRAGP